MTMKTLDKYIKDQDEVVTDLKARLNRAVGLIAKLEWAMIIGNKSLCPECGRAEKHHADCELRLLLNKEGHAVLSSCDPGARARYWEKRWEDARGEIADLRFELAKERGAKEQGVDLAPVPGRCRVADCYRMADDYAFSRVVDGKRLWKQMCPNRHEWITDDEGNTI